MMSEVIESRGAPAPAAAYSQGLRVGSLVALSGQVGIVPGTGAIADGVAAQTWQAVANLEAVLASAGGSLQSLVKTTCFLAAIEDFGEFDAAYAEAMGDHRPARSTVGVRLPGAYLVEIEGLAVLDAP